MTIEILISLVGALCLWIGIIFGSVIGFRLGYKYKEQQRNTISYHNTILPEK